MRWRTRASSPGSVGYVEAHGTATPLGDPVEVAALALAFLRLRRPPAGSCAIGSVKSNVGHLDSAAGVAGFIKAVLCLRHGELVPSLHYHRPNPRVGFEQTPFYVNTQPEPWVPSGGAPRRAGVSSFGIGGTNAHVVLEEPPPTARRAAADRARAAAQVEAGAGALYLLPLSARDPGALRATARRWRDLLATGRAPLAAADATAASDAGSGTPMRCG